MNLIVQVQDRLWRDLGYGVRATPGNHNIDGHPLCVTFIVYEIAGYACEGGAVETYTGETEGYEYGKPLFVCEGATVSEQMTEDMGKATVQLDAEIKWDGCAHLRPINYTHICSRGDARKLGAMLERLYDLAAELMPEHAEEYLT